MTEKAQGGRIAYLSSLIPALSATFIYREVLELQRRDYSLRLYSLRRPELRTLSAESIPLYNRAYFLLPARFVDVVIDHLRYAVTRPHRYVATFWKMIMPRHHRPKDRLRTVLHFGEAMVLARRMERDGITHIHAHYASQVASVARVVHLITGIPYSISAHADDIWHDRLLLRQKLREARFVACCSESGRRELIRQGDAKDAGKVSVVYHGIDIRHFAPPPNGARSPDLILAVGRLAPAKGYPHLVEACRLLKQNGVRFKCRIVGDGEDRPLIAALVAQYALNDCIELAGAVPQENLLAHYQEAAVFALPCIPTPDGRHDGIPNVLVEAMATALPVVSTPLGGIPELVNDGQEGFVVPVGDSQALARRLKQLLEDPALRRSLGDAGRRRTVAHFDNRETIEPLISLFTKECGLQPHSTKV